MEPDLPFAIQTRQSDSTRLTKKYNTYEDDFVVDRIDLKTTLEELVGLEEITVSQDIDIDDDHDEEWIEDWSKPKVEYDDEQQQSYAQHLTYRRVLEWLNEMTSDPKETIVTIQDVDRESMKCIKLKKMIIPGPARKDNYLFLRYILRYTIDRTSMDIFVREVVVGLTHTEKLLMKIKNSKRDR